MIHLLLLDSTIETIKQRVLNQKTDLDAFSSHWNDARMSTNKFKFSQLFHLLYLFFNLNDELFLTSDFSQHSLLSFDALRLKSDDDANNNLLHLCHQINTFHQDPLENQIKTHVRNSISNAVTFDSFQTISKRNQSVSLYGASQNGHYHVASMQGIQPETSLVLEARVNNSVREFTLRSTDSETSEGLDYLMLKETGQDILIEGFLKNQGRMALTNLDSKNANFLYDLDASGEITDICIHIKDVSTSSEYFLGLDKTPNRSYFRLKTYKRLNDRSIQSLNLQSGILSYGDILEKDPDYNCKYR